MSSASALLEAEIFKSWFCVTYYLNCLWLCYSCEMEGYRIGSWAVDVRVDMFFVNRVLC
jgi:hypothetical protein